MAIEVHCDNGNILSEGAELRLEYLALLVERLMGEIKVKVAYGGPQYLGLVVKAYVYQHLVTHGQYKMCFMGSIELYF